MSDQEIRDFLLSPVRPAVLATSRPDGRTHAAPIWYALDGDEIVFNTGAETVKGRNLAASDNLTLCVQDDQPPYSFVTIEGHAELVDDLEQVRLWAGRIGGRYMGAERAEEYGARNGVPGELLVRVRVSHMSGASDLAE